MVRTLKRIRRPALVVVAMTLMASLVGLPGPGPALAHVRPDQLDVEAELTIVNRGQTVVLTATINEPAPSEMNIDFENEGGANDLEKANTQENPDRNCNIPQLATQCEVSYAAAEPGRDLWRAWIDHDFRQDGRPAGASNATAEADDSEGRDETLVAGGGCTNDMNRGAVEPDCTDVVEVFTDVLEVIPEISRNQQPGTTVRLTAHLFTPAPLNGVNIDFENENGTNDPDRSISRETPDLTCDIPPLGTDCFIEYVGAGGRDVFRAWIDADRTQSTVEADEDEGRFSGNSGSNPSTPSKPDAPNAPEGQGIPGDDCGHPGDVRVCGAVVRVPEVTDVSRPAEPGTGCKNPNSITTTAPDRTEPDCTDVVEVLFSAGAAALLDCDDQSGNQTGNDTERETNPSDPNRSDQDDAGSTERYRCRLTDPFGTGINDQFVKAEIENGINDGDSNTTEQSPSYESPDYSCETTFDRDVDPVGLLGDPGVCYIQVKQNEGELGTAEICFWFGTAAEGASLCSEELTGEAQEANGTDRGNDLADQAEKTWENPATFRVDCNPETDTNPAGTAHTVSCTATSPSGATVNDVNIDVEATGANDPDMSNTPEARDFSCQTGAGGACSFTHGPGGMGSTSAEGTTVYRAWLDADGQDPTVEADRAEARDENTTPGTRAEPDNTDVVDKIWGPAPTSLSMTPESDSASVGECNAFTVTLKDRAGNPVRGAIIDVEQRHELATNQTNNDEPTVGFCEPDPAGGPNTSDVDESRGDLANPPENPDNRGTAGGETVETTDQNGQITFGIEVAPGQGSNGSGNVSVTAFFETSDNDDADSTEPSDSSTKTWAPRAGEPGVPAALDLQPNFSTDPVGSTVEYSATVSDANGDPVEGARVEWAEDGPGELSSQQATTDENGRATATVTSNETGDQTITAESPDCGAGATCEDSSTQQWVRGVSSGPCKGFGEGTRNDRDGDGDEDVIVGTQGDDVITGTSEGDTICGLGGNDSIDGGGGNDKVVGNSGKDTLRGDAGNDRLIGGGGNDVLEGGSGNDTLTGGGGRDVLKGGSGEDVLNAGSGNDVMNGGTGRDRCRGGPGRDSEKSC